MIALVLSLVGLAVVALSEIAWRRATASPAR